MIFISYRRGEEPFFVNHLYEFLSATFGKERVVMDIDSIPLGVDFRSYALQRVGQAHVAIAIIGPNWETASDKSARSGWLIGKPAARIHNHNDYMRCELEAAHAANVPIIPIYVSRTATLREGTLPETLRFVPYLNGVEVRATDAVQTGFRRVERAITDILAAVAKSNAASVDVVGKVDYQGFALEGYRLDANLGSNEASTTYKAWQDSMSRNVAIKVLREDAIPEHAIKESYKQRFIHSAKVMARVSHRHVCGSYDAGRQGEYTYCVMEYLGGRPLVDEMKTGLGVEGAISVVIQVAKGLKAIHEQKLVHRDVNPRSILRRARTHLCVIAGFDLVYDRKNTEYEAKGMMVGRPSYMSPEQMNALELDGRSDMYSLGVMFYELLSGRLPYRGKTPLEVLKRHLEDPIPELVDEPTLLGFRGGLNSIIGKMLAKRRDDRFETMDELLDKIASLGIQFGVD